MEMDTKIAINTAGTSATTSAELVTAYAGGHGDGIAQSQRVASGHTTTVIGMGAGLSQRIATARGDARRLQSEDLFFSRSRSYTEGDLGRVERLKQGFESAISGSHQMQPEIQQNSEQETEIPKGADDVAEATPVLSVHEERAEHAQSGSHEGSAIDTSPRREFIIKMRTEEEEAINKCRKILRKMKAAMAKQRNISMDVKDGVSEIEEVMDIIQTCRKSWMQVEKEKQQADKTRTYELQERELETPTCTRLKRVAENPIEPESSKKVRERDSSKRPATSPVKPMPGKKARAVEPGEWQIATNKKQQNSKAKKKTENQAESSRESKEQAARKKEKPRQPKQRREAVLIKPGEKSSYADVLRGIREKVKPEQTEAMIRSVRKTKNGDVLLELLNGEKKDQLCGAIKDSLGDLATVVNLKQRITIEIRDLDSLTDKEEVAEAVKTASQLPNEEVKVHVTEANAREQRRAFVTMSAEASNNIRKLQRIKVGFISCRYRIRQRSNVKFCYRCLGPGHWQSDCKGPDRKDVCRKCGEKGHIKKDCKNPPKCCICVQESLKPTDHVAGSERCPLFNKGK